VTVERVRSAAVTLPDGRTSTQRYLDEVAPASIVGRLVKFTKEGSFATADDGEPVSGEHDFLVLADETLVGWIRFRDDGSPPDRIQGLLYEGFVPPAREALGDTDPAAWPIGISGGGPADPWQHQMCLVLQHRDTHEMYTFATTSVTGRRAVGNLLKHYDRLRRGSADGQIPIVKLRAGGFNHRDPRIGWVPTPVFAVVGAADRANAAHRPSNKEELQDSIPF